MSVEMITMLVSVVSILLALAGGFGWMVRRMDASSNSLENRLGARIDGVETRLGARIDGVDAGLGARIDGVETSLGSRIDGLSDRIDKVADELVEVKVAVARLEGTPRHLIPTR